MYEWNFATQRPNSERRNPTEDNFFRNEDGIVEALVREVIQNSLDARDCPELPVKVSFCIREMESGNDQELKRYFQRLAQPLREHFDFDILSELSSKFKYLVCEDYNTRGLEGDTKRVTPPAANSNTEDFFWFWRNTGNSGKVTGVGRWGLGKTVYNATSLARTRFGITVRKSDGKRFLMGKTVLKTHIFKDREFEPYGFWCQPVENQSGILPCPIEDEKELNNFSRLWNIHRTNEPGLSVVVPFIRDQEQPVDALKLAQNVIQNFFVKILQGGLEVEITDETGLRYEISCSTLKHVAEKILFDIKTSDSGKKRLDEFQKTLTAIQFACPALESKKPFGTIDLTSLTTIPKEGNLEQELRVLRDAAVKEYQAHKPLLFHIKMLLKHRLETNLWGGFYVVIQKSEDSNQSTALFVRNGMTIPDIKGVCRGVQGVVFVEESPIDEYGELAKFLGDSEEPSHRDWMADKQQLDEKGWKEGKGRVEFIKNILKALHRILSPTPTVKKDYNILGQFFSLPRKNPGIGERNSVGGNGTGCLPTDIQGGKKSWFQIQKMRGGFRIMPTEKRPPNNAKLYIKVAYDTNTGNPFKKWCKYDFIFYSSNPSLEKVDIIPSFKEKAKQKNVKWLKPSPDEFPAGNQITLQIDNPDEPFSFEITGFKKSRDLVVDIKADDINEDMLSVSEEDRNEA